MKKQFLFSVVTVAGILLVTVIASLNPISMAQAQEEETIEFVGQIGGPTTKMVIQGNFAYVGDSNRLAVLNISNPNAPTLVGRSVRFTSTVENIAVSGNYAYLDVENRFKVVDISNPAAIRVVGELGINVSDFVIKENYAYVTHGGLTVINIENPLKLNIVTTLKGNYSNLLLLDKHLYVVTTFCFSGCIYNADIIDISNPSNPVKVSTSYIGRYLFAVTNNHIFYYHQNESSSEGALRALDVSNPISPTIVGQIAGNFSSIAASGNYVYVSSRESGSNKYEGWQVIDVSLPSDMVVINKQDTPIGITDIVIQDKQLYGLGNDGLSVYDISGPSSPIKQGSWKRSTTQYNFSIDDNYLYSILKHSYDSNTRLYQCRLQISNFENLDNPIVINDTYTFPSEYRCRSSNKIVIKDRYAYVVANKKLRIIDISTISNPKEVGVVDTSRNGELVIHGNYAYVGDWGVTVVDISNPTSPTVIASLDLKANLNPRSTSSMDIVGNYLYLTLNSSDSNNNGLYVIDVTNPAKPVQATFLPGDSKGLAIKDNYIYIFTGDKLRIVDISNPANPVRVGVYSPGDKVAIGDIQIEGNYAYGKTYENYNKYSIMVLDITKPTQPVQVTSYSLNGSEQIQNIQKGYIYVRRNGLTVLRFTGASTQPTPTPTPTATPTQPNSSFQVNRDGLSFENFGYYGANWEQFKKTFPDTEMELPDGSRRKGAANYFNSWFYQSIGEGGNCAGFTAVSLIRHLNLTETVERDLLTPEHQLIEDAYSLPPVVTGDDINVGESDVKDYIHLYQARQISRQFVDWQQAHRDDTPLQTYQAIRTATQNGEPVAVDVRQNGAGHRMVAYRTEKSGNTGYIYVYDNNWPDEDDRFIEVNLTTGAWEYNLLSEGTSYIWRGITDLKYAPASLNFPAQTFSRNYQSQALFANQASNDTLLTINGQANMLITDAEGNRFGYQDGQLINEIPEAVYLYELGYDPDNPDTKGVEGFFIPESTLYSVAIKPIANSGVYTLAAFGSGSVMSLNSVEIMTGTTDSLRLNGSVTDSTFSASDADYCHSITREVSDTSSREFVSCVASDTSTALTFSLSSTGNAIDVNNRGDNSVNLTTTIDQVGDNAGSNTITEQLAAGEITTITADGGRSNTYLPIVVK